MAKRAHDDERGEARNAVRALILERSTDLDEILGALDELAGHDAPTEVKALLFALDVCTTGKLADREACAALARAVASFVVQVAP
jgi:hypothetical protein